MTTLEHVLAQSMALRASHTRPKTPTSAVDDFPVLARAPSQIDVESLRVLTARAASASPSNTLYASALRLLATHGFDLDRLRDGVAALDTGATFVDTPDRPLPPFRNPLWLAPRAADDARLTLNKTIRASGDDLVKRDSLIARDALVSALSALYPAPNRSPFHTSGVGLSPSVSSRSRPRRSGSSGGGGALVVSGGSGIAPFPEIYSPPPAVASLPLPQQYVDAVRSIATHGEAHSAPMLLREAADVADDGTHFRLTLDIVARAARYARLGTPPHPDMQVWAARTVLEDYFASRIPGMPPCARVAEPRAVISVVERLVDNASTANAAAAAAHRHHTPSTRRTLAFTSPLRSATPTARPDPSPPDTNATDDTLLFKVPHRPSAWFCVYVCLRCGAVEAARILLERTSFAPGQFFAWFADGQEEIRRGFAAHLRVTTGTDDDNNNNALGFDPLTDAAMPCAPGCLSSEDQYEDVAREYRNAALTSDDPYMRACYVLLMRLDLSSPASVAATDEDDAAAAAMADNTGRGVSRRSMIAGGVHERFSLYLSDSDFETVFPTVEDFQWLQLWLCRTPSEAAVVDRLPHSSFVTIHNVRAQIRECGGDAHFVDADGQRQPLLYTFVLALSAQFASAVQYLYEQPNEHWMHYAIHLALALYHANWVDTPDIGVAPIQPADEQAMERMIGRYVECVALRDLSDAVLYVLALRDAQSVKRLVRELVASEAFELDALVGRVGDDGRVLRVGALLGSIPIQNINGNGDGPKLTCGLTRNEIQALSQDIAREHAHEAQLRGEFGRAADLYAVAGNLDRTADMRMRDAADQVHRLSSSRRAATLQAARAILCRWTEHNDATANHRPATSTPEPPFSWHTVHALRTLLDMAGAFEDYWTGRYAAAWSRLRTVGVVPMSQQDISHARKLVESLGHSMLSHSDERARERERGRHRRRRSSGGGSVSGSIAGITGIAGIAGVGGGTGSGTATGSALNNNISNAASTTAAAGGRAAGDDDDPMLDNDWDRDNAALQTKGPAIAECVVEMLKVALHVADYALESGSIRSEAGEPAGTGVPSTPREDAFALPSVDEIKSVSAFAAMLQCGDQAVDERLMRIEQLMLSG